MKPNVSVLASRSALEWATDRWRIRARTVSITALNAVRASPALQSSRNSRTSIPTNSRTLLRRLMTKAEKNPPSSLASPSIRSIISPGVCSLWKDMSSDRQCFARSALSALVAAQPTRPLAYAANTLTICCAIAMTVKSAAAPTSRLTGLPASASSMK